MRLKIILESNNGPFAQPNKHAVQGFIYNMLKGTEYSERHDEPRFKFFTFSDFFRGGGAGRPSSCPPRRGDS